MAKAEDVWDVTKEQQESSQNIVPTLQLTQYLRDNNSIEVEFTEDAPREIEVPKKDDKGNVTEEKEKRKAITVTALGTEYTLWLGASSLRIPLANLWEQHNNSLKGVRVRISKTTGKHPKYGDVDYYRVQELTGDE